MYYLLLIGGAVSGKVSLYKWQFGAETPWNIWKILFVGFCIFAIATMTYQAYTGGK